MGPFARSVSAPRLLALACYARNLLAVLVVGSACALAGCGGPVEETRKAGEESKVLEGIFYLTDAQVDALRKAGIPDGAILERDMVRAAWGDDVVTIVLESVTEAQGKALHDDPSQFASILDKKNSAFKVRSHFEGNKFYFSIGPIKSVRSAQGKIRFGSVMEVDDANRVIRVKYKAPKIVPEVPSRPKRNSESTGEPNPGEPAPESESAPKNE